MSSEAMTWIRTKTGRTMDLADPDPDLICIEDIATSLSRQVRFSGHIPVTVAEHCIHVSLEVPPELALVGLLHDAAEAYTGDVSAPMKNLLEDYDEVYDPVERAVAERFGLDYPWPEEVQRADLICAQAEANRGWRGQNVDIGLEEVPAPEVVPPREPRGFHRSDEWWKDRFLLHFDRYTSGSFNLTHPQYLD